MPGNDCRCAGSKVPVLLVIVKGRFLSLHMHLEMAQDQQFGLKLVC
jgi:hypothetical protein